MQNNSTFLRASKLLSKQQAEQNVLSHSFLCGYCFLANTGHPLTFDCLHVNNTGCRYQPGHKAHVSGGLLPPGVVENKVPPGVVQ